MKTYNHKQIETKWQKIWNAKKAYKTKNPKDYKGKKINKKYYVLDMFPYPSGAGLHVGHPKGYIGSDVFARTKRMQGYNVLHPMGYDAFGLPAEQYAIEHNINPAQAVEKNVKTFERQLSIIGLSYDWDRRVNTTDPNFYKWTQWIFLKIYNSYYNKKTNKAEPIEKLIKIFNKNGNKDVDAVCDKNVEIFGAKEWKEKTKKEKQDMLMKYRLAYEGYAEVNWCPQLGTVLANDEVVDGKDGGLVSERGGFPVEKKLMRQWFMRITAYADRLLLGLDGLNWSTHIKEIQKNWIGKSEGAEIEFEVASNLNIKVFTTRPDTVFGVTFLAISPELAKKISGKDFQIKTNTEEKEKIGIDTGLKAKNKANGEMVPIYVVNYVSANYGTGAVMGVPAHDERDFEFAKKYNLPIKQVIRPVFGLEDKKAGAVHRNTITGIVKSKDGKKILMLQWKDFDMKESAIIGGIEEGESPENAAEREVLEETGYKTKAIFVSPVKIESHFFAKHKNEWRSRIDCPVLLELIDEKPVSISDKEKETHVSHWVDIKDLPSIPMFDNNRLAIDLVLRRGAYTDCSLSQKDLLINSGEFNGLHSKDVKKKITEFVGGKIVTNYKMRDAIFARQRYWGEPIPLSHDKEGIITELSEKKLPLKLPKVTSYKPTGTGESPLANVKDWMKKGYETNTMPGWAGSSWYFLRYMDPKNKRAFADKANIKYWKNVDMYVGGQEHATGHLLYSRFWHKFLKDYGLVETEEPFQTLRNQGMILGTDNRKMSKRWGNVINPDEVVKNFGADTLRLYEMFMGPFEASLPWSTDNIVGSRRFLERVWKISTKLVNDFSRSGRAHAPIGRILGEENRGPEKLLTSEANKNFQHLLHKTIKKVTEDVENFSFNTAVSSLMILLNEMEKEEKIDKKDFEIFIKLLSPMAPHISEEIWSMLGNKNLIVLESWPKYDEKMMQESKIKIIVQVNGKMRAEIFVNTNDGEEAVKEKASQDPTIAKYLSQNEVKKVIYVSGRLVNFVVQ